MSTRTSGDAAASPAPPASGVGARIAAAVAAVVDPEYPGITIEALGILEAVRVSVTDAGRESSTDAGREGLADAGPVRAEVDLVPTVLGCPALGAIEADVAAAARDAGADDVLVRFLTQPTWTPDRITPAARRALADELTIAIRRRDGSVRCPVCGSVAVQQRSAFGPTLCRELWWCDACRNPVEVVRR